MPKSLLYVPGLAIREILGQPGHTNMEFKTKINSTFKGDGYMTEMVKTILNKGATPVDCTEDLNWIEIPKLAPRLDTDPKPRLTGAAKALSIMGPQSSNILSLEAGKPAKPMSMTIGMTLTPCTAPEYLSQPKPSRPKGAPQPLAGIVKGDTLYIVGHSNALGGSLTYKCPALGHIVKSPKEPDGCDGWQHAEKRHIDPVTLGSLLINEGLPKGVQFDIALVACFSGGLDDSSLQTVQCFAQRLAGTLSAHKVKCRVYGATGLTSSSNSEVEVATTATKLPDGKILLDHTTKKTLRDNKNMPFYRRFFRFFS